MSGDKTSSGSGETSDAFSLQDDNLTLTTPFGSTGGSASMTGTGTTSYSYTERAFLDQNGTWQVGSGSGSSGGSGSGDGSGSFTASGSQNWSLSGAGASDYQTTVYGNPDSGTLNANGSGADSYQYTQYYKFRPDGQWLPASGSGGSSGSGSVTWGYAVSGGYSSVDPAWLRASGSVPAAITLGTDWSGTTAASAGNTASYGYTTNSVFSGGAWQSSGSASATSSGWTSSSFSASSPFNASYDDGQGNAMSLSGTASGSGNDDTGFSYTETASLQTNGAWDTLAAGSASAWGDSSADWSYSGSGSYSQSQAAGSLSGTLGESGDQSFSMDYHDGASYSPGGGWDWTGSGSVAASASYNYSYSGSGNGTANFTPSNSETATASWNLNENGGGSGTNAYSDALSVNGNGWTHDATSSSCSRDEDVFSDDYTASDTHPAPGGGTTTENFAEQVADDKISENGQVTSGQSPTTTPTGGDLPWWDTALGPNPSAPSGLMNTDELGFPLSAIPAGNSVPTPPATAAGSPFGAATFFGAPRLPRSIPSAPDANAVSLSGSPVASLVGLAPSPQVVDAVWGMAFTADAAPQRALALGNPAGPYTNFTVEQMKGADAVFGSNNVAVLLPEVDSALLADNGFTGVSGGGGAGGGGSADLVGGVSADATPAGEGGGSGTSNPATDPMTDVIVPNDPRQRLKQSVDRLIDGRTQPWTAEQKAQFRKGFGDGFVGGLKGILDLLKSIPEMNAAAGKAVIEAGAMPGKLAVWSMEVIGDEIGSWLYGVKPDVFQEGVNRGRQVVNQARNMGLTAVQVGRLLADLNGLPMELLTVLGGYLGTDLTSRFPGLSPGTGGLKGEFKKAINRVIDNASPLTVVLLEAISDLGPYEQGYAAGLIYEQVAEWALISLATDGAGALAESEVFQARLLKLMESLQGLAKNSERLQAIVKALRETKLTGRTMEEVAEQLRAALRALRDDNGELVFPGGPKEGYWKGLNSARRSARLTEDVAKNLRTEARGIMGPRFGFVGLGDWEKNAAAVHHTIPLEYAHLFPEINPNSAGRLAVMSNVDHDAVTLAWRNWAKSLGHEPTASEVLEEARVLERQFGDKMWIRPGKHF